MIIEDYIRHLDADALRSHGKLSPSRELLEQLIDMVFRLEREAVLGMNYDHQAGQNGSYTNSFKSEGISKTSGTLNRLVSDVPNPVDTPLYPSTFKRGQRSSEALLNAAAECYLEGVSTRDSGKIFDQFEIVSMSSTQVSRY